MRSLKVQRENAEPETWCFPRTKLWDAYIWSSGFCWKIVETVWLQPHDEGCSGKCITRVSTFSSQVWFNLTSYYQVIRFVLVELSSYFFIFVLASAEPLSCIKHFYSSGFVKSIQSTRKRTLFPKHTKGYQSVTRLLSESRGTMYYVLCENDTLATWKNPLCTTYSSFSILVLTTTTLLLWFCTILILPSLNVKTT